MFYLKQSDKNVNTADKNDALSLVEKLTLEIKDFLDFIKSYR